MSRIFISYVKENYRLARKLYEGLRTLGENPWLDRENLIPGQRW